METLVKDLRYAVRTLWARPAFALTAIVTLALAIGANTAIFSLVNAVLLGALPFPDPDQLVMIWEDASEIGFPRNTPAPANYAAWSAQNTVFERVAAVADRGFTLGGGEEPERVVARGVTAGFFPLLGVQPALGRVFAAEEDTPGAGHVAVLSHGLWQRRFGGDEGVVGSDILLDGDKYTVVGVMPARFEFLESYVGLWVPAALSAEELASRGAHYLTVVARMKPGVTEQRAQADVQAITARIARDFPEEARGLSTFLRPLREELIGDVRRPLVVLSAAVAAVLVIACANVAGLLLARAATRRREMAVRVALGARRGRIVRQLLTESLLLAALGAVPGLLAASWALSFLRQLIPPGLALLANPALDLRALGYALLVSLLTAVLFGLTPALQASRNGIQDGLRQGARGLAGGDSRRLRGALVVAEVAATLVLLVGAGLLAQTLYRLRYVDLGLRSSNVLTLRTSLPPGKYEEHEKRTAYYDEVLDRVAALPGVLTAGYTTSVPLEWKGGTNTFVREGLPADPSVSCDANHRQVSAGYLQAMSIPLRAGRYFDRSDGARTPPVVIVNETMARQYWPQEDALGRRLRIGDPRSGAPWRTIVGIVGDVRQMGLAAPVKAEMYFPHSQIVDQPWFAPRDLVIRSSVDPMSLVAAAKREIRAVDPEQAASNIRTLDDILDEEVLSRRLGATLFAAFAVLAVLLASLGIYGVLSHFVAEHTPEIGVRLALGARPSAILGLVLRRGLSLTLVGVGLGAIGALGLTRLLSSLLYGVGATDPMTFAGAAAVLIALAVLACLVPALRAVRIDPTVAMRYE